MGHQERVIRLFVSSTFADMREEREQLAKFAFPKLRKLCEERGIVWSEVDLRWGITDQQKAKGQVLDICLAEIDQCRPFFLAILGNRYGWIPEITEDLVQRYPWLADRQGCSLLELEILHGALNHPAAAGEALFYARRGGAGGEQDQGAAKLAELGGRIRESGLRFREGYTTAAELAEWVVADVVEAGGTEDAVVLGAAEERTIPAPQTRLREPADDEVEDTLITDRPLVTVDDEARYTPLAPDKRRFIRPVIILLVVLLIAGAGLGSAYAWTRTQYFVGVSGDQVAIYQGLSDGVPGVRLSRVFEVQPLAVADLPPYYQEQVRGNIEAPNLESARATIVELMAAVKSCANQKPPKESPTPTPKPTSTRATSPTPTPTSTSAGPGELDC